MPMHGTADYWRMQALAHVSTTPVLVNVSQHYALLADAVSRALEALPTLRRIVLGFWTSFPIRLPQALLDERVLLTAQPARAAQAELDRSGAELLLIEDRLRRDLTERGDNAIGVALIGQRPSEERFASLVRQTALFSPLEGISCRQP